MKKSRPFLFALLAALTIVCRQSTLPTDWSEFSEQTVAGSLDALLRADSIYLSTMETQGVGAAAEAARTFLEGEEAVAQLSIPEDSSVTVLFANGLLGVISEPDLGTRDSLVTHVPPETPARVAAGGEVIASAVILTPFAHEFGAVAEDWVAGKLDTCFGGPDSVAQRISDEAVTVDKIGQVLAAGPGVLLWSGHGVLLDRDAMSGDDWVALVTGETHSSSQMAHRIIDKYAGGARASGEARELIVVATKRKIYLAVTPRYVRNHGNFDYMEGMGTNATKSLVYICCCHSGLESGDMPRAFWEVGVDAYLGWSKQVKSLFAAQRQLYFFYNATDTCTVREAYYGIGQVTDPWKGAQLLHYSADSVMIRSQMRFEKDGTSLRGYSIGVALAGGVTTVNCFAGQPKQQPEYGITVHFPDTGPGSWNCLSTEDAEILVTDFRSGKYFIVKKDLVGVAGTIEAARYDDCVVSGTFSGTLGYWTMGQNPEEDPPSETFEIQNGFFKHVGLRQ